MFSSSVRIAAVVVCVLVAGCLGDGGNDRAQVDDQPAAAYEAPSQSGPEDNTITPVLFIPSDEQVGEATVDALRVGLADLEAWYERELETTRLRVGSLEIVNGKHSSAHYLEEDRIWSEGPTELTEALGFSPWQEGHIVLLVGAGLLGWAGGNGSGISGYAVLGLESLTGSSRCAEQWWCTPTVWRGTAIHELGHALTLPHSIEPSIMSIHTDYLDKMLLDSEDWPEKTTVLALPFVEPLDGSAEQPEPEPEPSTCDGGVPVGGTACDEQDGSYERVCFAPESEQSWIDAPCSPGQSCKDGHCQATTTGCVQYGSLQDCNDHGVSCAWYACANRCMPKGTPLETACGCQHYTTLASCDAATTGGCAWYACASSCLPEGTPMDLACP